MTAVPANSTRISRRFAELRERGELGIVAYITAGDPSLDATLQFVRAIADAGADVIELGVPFSDPLADGPVNLYVTYAALQVLDVYTTTRALDAGRSEGNPVMSSVATSMASAIARNRRAASAVRRNPSGAIAPVCARPSASRQSDFSLNRGIGARPSWS